MNPTTLRLSRSDRQTWSQAQALAGMAEDQRDGIPGPRTAAAMLGALGAIEGLPDSLPRDPISTPAAPVPAACVNGVFPPDRDPDLDRYFGAPGNISTAWFDIPYPMFLYGDRSKPITRHRCHPKVKGSLERILMAIRQAYSDDEIAFLGLDRFYGVTNVRRRRGGRRWSLHAYSAAIDLDANRNRLGQRWAPEHAAEPGKPATAGWAWMPVKVVEIFECHGWSAGARWRTADAMHFEATSR